MTLIAPTFGRTRLATGMLALSMAFGSTTFGEDERNPLIDSVKQHESRFANFSADVATFQWTGKDLGEPGSVEMRRIVHSRGRFYESNYFSKAAGGRPDFGFRLIASDGQVASISRAPDEVEIHIGESSHPETFQPYAVLLATLGYQGTLSKFLGETPAGRNKIHIEFGDDEEFANLKTNRLRGLRRVEETSRTEVFDLRLAVDHAYLPCWGRVGVEDADQPRVESMVDSFTVVGAGIPLMRQIVTTNFSSNPGQTPGSKTVIQIDAEILGAVPPDEVFRLSDFSGDATVLNYTDGVLRSQTTFHPKPIKREVWPAYMIWIVINDIVLCILVISYLTRTGFRLFLRWRPK